jgi:hypothetical protein
MFRVHQFDKVEMFVYCRPEESWDEHERMLAIEEELVQTLGLPYRVVDVAAATSARRRRRSTTSRRGSRARSATARSPPARTRPTFRRGGLQIRFRPNGGPQPVHTLNGTAATTAGCSPCSRTSSARTDRSRFPRRCRSTELPPRSDLGRFGRRVADVESATLIQIALGESSACSRAFRLCSNRSSSFSRASSARCRPLDGRLEVYCLSLA